MFFNKINKINKFLLLKLYYNLLYKKKSENINFLFSIFKIL